jgi:hypothetical protein
MLKIDFVANGKVQVTKQIENSAFRKVLGK